MTLQCLATLVANVPYQRLKPGLLTRIVKQIKPFLSHRGEWSNEPLVVCEPSTRKLCWLAVSLPPQILQNFTLCFYFWKVEIGVSFPDPNIRVACLTCLGSIVNQQAPLVEVGLILKNFRPPARLSESIATETSLQPESGYHSNISDGSHGDSASGSGIATPNLPSGCQTPSLSDQALFGPGGEISWLVKLCVKNVASYLLEVAGSDTSTSRKSEVSPRKHEQQVMELQPLPVRLESLQLLAQLARGHFGLVRWVTQNYSPFCDCEIRTTKNWVCVNDSLYLTSVFCYRNCLVLVRDLILCCLEDSDPSVQLHGAKVWGTVHSAKYGVLTSTGSQIKCVYLHNNLVHTTSAPRGDRFVNSHSASGAPGWWQYAGCSAGNEHGDSDVEVPALVRSEIVCVVLLQVQELWLPVLSGPLPAVLQDMAHHAVRSTACDCLSNIGAAVFEKLPVSLGWSSSWRAFLPL